MVFELHFISFLPHEHAIATASHPSVHPSVTLRYRGHIGWNAFKIIS